jgi:hypothetical protein
MHHEVYSWARAALRHPALLEWPQHNRNLGCPRDHRAGGARYRRRRLRLLLPLLSMDISRKQFINVAAPTPYLWVIGRTKTDGPEGYDVVHKIQARYKVMPLSLLGKSAGAGDREDRPQRRHNADGSLNLYFQNESLGQDKEANWLLAPKGAFNLTMRLHGPKSDALTGKWSPAAVKKAP